MNHQRLRLFPKLALTLALAATSTHGLTQPPSTDSLATTDAILQKLDAMSAEMTRLKAELQSINAQQQAAHQQTKEVITEQAKLMANPATVVTGYGEMNYNRPTNQNTQTQVDLRRVVIGMQHRFDDKTKFVGEFEWEHAVTSASDQGESEVEQAYVEHALSDKLALKAGLMLMPFGLLNENHEPTSYYGVERNFVETAIIPSTWREGGLMLLGKTDTGLSWSTGLVTGFDLGKWQSNSTDGKASPLGSIHQEGQLAKAKNMSVLGSLDWRGTPGLLVGGSVFAGQVGHGQIAGAHPAVTLWDLHARWTPGKWDLSTVYAQGAISDTGSLNAALVANSTLIPAKFGGTYVQAAYNAWSGGSYQLKPFVRKEWFNTGMSFEATGLNLAPDAVEMVSTVGANFHISQHVVFKADYQRFALSPSRNRVDLAVGWSF
jgi:Phosphate-selective porin O and P